MSLKEKIISSMAEGMWENPLNDSSKTPPATNVSVSCNKSKMFLLELQESGSLVQEQGCNEILGS